MVVPNKKAESTEQVNTSNINTGINVVEISMEDFLAMVVSQPEKRLVPAILNEETG